MNLNYAWLVRKSKVVVVNCKNGFKVGSWDFANTLQDDSVEINAVQEMQRPNGKESHLVISLNCQSKGGIICIFDFVGSKVIRAIRVGEQVNSVRMKFIFCYFLSTFLDYQYTCYRQGARFIQFVSFSHKL